MFGGQNLIEKWSPVLDVEGGIGDKLKRRLLLLFWKTQKRLLQKSAVSNSL